MVFSITTGRMGIGDDAIQCMGLQLLKRHYLQCILVGRGHYDWRGNSGVESFLPTSNAHAPTIARLQTRKSPLGVRRAQVVAVFARKRKEFGRHVGTQRMRPDIVGPGFAATSAEESSQW